MGLSAGAICPFRDGGPVWLNRPVSNPDPATRISDRARAAGSTDLDRLVDATPGRRLRVVAVGSDHESALAQEGVGVGAQITLERRLAPGGPLIVRLGPTRLALAKSVAATIRVAVAGEVVGTEQCP